jgi:hypothetical protein
MDLFAVATGNAASLDLRIEALNSTAAAARRATLDRFARRVADEGRISLNMRLSTLLAFLITAGRHENMYEWVAARARRSTLTEDEILHARLGAFYERRRAFDDHFTNGKSFRYGALNMGGSGATNYGDCCAVVGAPPVAWELAFLRSDSLLTYLKPGLSVDEDLLAADAAPHSHRHQLALLKHEADVESLPDARWPDMLCCNDDYVEAIFVGELLPSALACVRMPRISYDLYFDLAFEDFRTRLDDANRTVVENFVMVLDALKARLIPLEVCDDA